MGLHHSKETVTLGSPMHLWIVVLKFTCCVRPNMLICLLYAISHFCFRLFLC